jgi:O-antigen ligase
MRSWRSAVVAAMPVVTVAAVDPSGLAPFGPLRFAAVSALTLAIAALLLCRGRPTVPRPVAWLGATVLVLAGVSTIAAGSMSAVVGTSERHYGFVTICIVAIAFLAGSAMDDRERLALRLGSVVAGVFVGGYTLWETFVSPPIAIQGASGRSGGPFGSAAFLGAACCLLFPLAIGSAAEMRWQRWFSRAVALTLLASVLASGTRAAVVALGVVGIVAGLQSGRLRQVFVMNFRVPVIAAGLIALAVVSMGLSGFSRGSKGASRLGEWRIGVAAVRQHPLLGVGPEGYRTVFPHVVDDAYVMAYGRVEITDRAHSGPLDLAIALGIPAGLAYLGLVALVLRRAWRLRRTNLAVAAAVAAYFVQQLVLFPLSELDPLAWMLAGTLFATSTPEPRVRSNPGSPLVDQAAVRAGPDGAGSGHHVADGNAVALALDERLQLTAGRHAQPAEHRPDGAGSGDHVADGNAVALALDERPQLTAGVSSAGGGEDLPSGAADVVVAPPRWARPLAVACAMASIAVVGAGVLEVAADHAAKRALAARATLDPQRAASEGRRVVQLRPDLVRNRVIAARAIETADEEAPLREALAMLDRAEELASGDPAVTEERALVLARIADRTGRPIDRIAARAAYEHLVISDPRNPRAWRGLALVARVSGDELRATEATRRAQVLSPAK